MNDWSRLHLSVVVAVLIIAGCLLYDETAIYDHPSDQTVTEGDTASFTVLATGTGWLTYQWKKDGLNVTGGTGGTTDTYTTPPTVVADSGAQFTCVVTSARGSVTSSAATLTVIP